MRARDFLKDDNDLPDLGKDTWAGGGTEFSPNWTQQIGIAGGQEAGTGGGQGFQRAQGNLPGGVNLGIAADYYHPEGNFAHQRGINVGYGPANINFGEKGDLGAGVNIPAGKGNLNLNVSGNQNKGVQGVGAQYSIGDPETKGGAFNIGVNKPLQGDPSINVGYSAKFEEDLELDEMAGEIHGGVRKALMDKGYKYLGSGIDKQAYLEPGTGQVLIVFGYRKGHRDFSPDQRMFIDWINYCNKNKNNPHLPRFSGFESFQFQGKNYIQARMEPLKELPDQVKHLVGYIDMAVDYIADGDFDLAVKDLARREYYDEVKNQVNPYTVKKIIKYLGGPVNAKNLLDTVHTVRKFGNEQGFAIDLHGGNYMQRANGTIVVNDPFVLWLRS